MTLLCLLTVNHYLSLLDQSVVVLHNNYSSAVLLLLFVCQLLDSIIE